jgi:thiopeptide-type bacteriocin biosynthesis protein
MPVTSADPWSARRLLESLAAPEPPPADRPWLAQSLSKGTAGIALLHIERALAGAGSWARAHAWITAAVSGPVSAADTAGLYLGLPAVAFMLDAASAGGRYQAALADTDAHLARLAHARADTATARARSGQLPGSAEDDGFSGLTGIGALLLRRDPGGSALEHVLRCLVMLTRPLRQVYVEFTDWDASERAFARSLAPLLGQARQKGMIDGWWFMRKHPCWRVRIRPAGGGDEDAFFRPALDALTADRTIVGWRAGIYEAEEAAFGGPEGMTVAHDLFIADSRAVMDLVAAPGDGSGLGRRELSVLLCTALLRGAGLEWYEQGGAWHRVTRERPLPADVPAGRLPGMAGSLRTLLIAGASPGREVFQPGGPAASAAGWADAFRRAGEALGALARAGTLQRGLRDVLAYHVIFHWNRLGLPARQQAVLARAARDAILGPVPSPRGLRPTGPARNPAGLDTVTGWFPLVPRPRLNCPDLETRISRIRELAESSRAAKGYEHRVDLACTALNQAALIAADCGLPDLAASLCERQFALFRAAAPLPGNVAVAGLQPLVNLARLDIRDGRPSRGWEGLDQIRQAVRDDGCADVHGSAFRLDGYTTAASMNVIARWLRGVLLQDGTRALAATGDWGRAAAHAAWHDDAPGLLREARQALILARVHAGDAGFALDLIDSAARAEPWEDAVAVCLRAYASSTAGRPMPATTIQALGAALQACDPDAPGTAVFRVRLGLTAAVLSAAASEPAEEIIAGVIREALGSGDAQAAREVLRHPAARGQLAEGPRRELSAVVTRAGLGQGSIPETLLTRLHEAIGTAESVLAATLAGAA